MLAVDSLRNLKEFTRKFGENFEVLNSLTNPYGNVRRTAHNYVTERAYAIPTTFFSTIPRKGQIIFPRQLPTVLEFDHSFPIRLQLSFKFSSESVNKRIITIETILRWLECAGTCDPVLQNQRVS